jgi:hypothetical protein
MTITIDRKRKESIEIFPTIDDFIKFLKSEYNNINFESDNIKSSIFKIYKKLLTEDGNVKYLRFSRWLPKQFRFKHSSKLSLPFWIERGFSELDYKEFTNDIFKERSDALKNYMKNLSDSLYIYDKDYSNIYNFNTSIFKLEDRPNCNLCSSELILKKSEKDNNKIYLIKGCSNKNCESKSNSKDIKWRAFLPEYKYNELKNNLKEVKRSFSKDFWIKRGLSEEEAINKVFEIQSNNSKKFKGKRTGKSKEKLKEKGYTDEEIRIACLSKWNTEYWIRKGYSEYESKLKVFEIQSYAAKHVDYDKRLLPSNLEYWLKRGLSEKEATNKISERQRTFSKDICIEKFGREKGLEVFNKRQEKWFNSLINNANIFIGYSKISQEIFKKIEKSINGEFIYAEKGGELRIRKENGGYYFYDFTDVKNKKIIEYNGDMYHANPLKYKADEYPHPFRRDIKSKEIWYKDFNKIKTAKENGYEVLVIWDSEYRYKGLENKQKVIQKCINFLSC